MAEGGCGCGGSRRRPAPAAAQTPRDSGSETPREALSYSDPGFTWDGPERATPEPTPTR